MTRALRMWIAASVFVAAIAAADGFRKDYFANTKSDSWAAYQSDDGTQYRYVRLPDENGQIRVQIQADFSKTKYESTPPSTTQYLLDKDCPFAHNAISMTRCATTALMHAGDSEVMVMQPDIVAKIRETAADYASTAKFLKSETVDGKKSDRYAYTVTYPDGSTETGEMWLSASVPFGLVKQAATMKDKDGNETSKYVMTLTASGTSDSKATVLVAPEAASDDSDS